MKMPTLSTRVATAGRGVQAFGLVLAATMKNVGMEFVFLLGWTSITWGVAGANLRWWAISIGTYMMLNALLAAWTKK